VIRTLSSNCSRIFTPTSTQANTTPRAPSPRSPPATTNSSSAKPSPRAQKNVPGSPSPGTDIQMALFSRLFLLVVPVLAAFFPLASLNAQMHSSNGALVLEHITVVDVRTGALQPDQTLVIEHDRIASISPAKYVKPSRGARIINCKGLFVIPGLWDMH